MFRPPWRLIREIKKQQYKGYVYDLEIEKETGISSVTISRINYWLHHGMGGYKLMLSRLGLMKEK